ncbi:uncharacterized protein Z519_07327 [Cladophialophora bantiana CBS 173.52]|uniref:BZIP domain-containing protein n=1 Tax=Cladophialophora bantiana (strain ATCC 10958 / CBS 173.52 / CDC B-1940 / NIH 8579) TaxID=1442370 RepID=A0A0D2HGD3_CLAB1|nr:uncharacterized protein Z519_07327 [Cladophialophora bantiana CBS 173.52]KIW92343.1 hypothetical protein Z519_07327 [Cladophialophora bantiana CBS 173.52]
MASGGFLQKQTVDRNRLNQRNFRARRQAYVQELEQRIRKLESDGVRATQEVQVAAQRVDRENRLLRRLLETRFGVDSHQISQYLSESKDAADIFMKQPLRKGCKTEFSRPSEEAVSTLALTPNPEESLGVGVTQHSSLTEATCPSEKKQQDPRILRKPPEDDYIKSLAGPSTSIDPLQPAEVESHIRLSNHRSPAALDSPTSIRGQTRDGECEAGHCHSCRVHPTNKRLRGFSAPSEQRPGTSGGETSCEEAARIIASLRGQNTCEDVWNELGCGTNQTCKVKNLSVFELLDKE